MRIVKEETFRSTSDIRQTDDMVRVTFEIKSSRWKFLKRELEADQTRLKNIALVDTHSDFRAQGKDDASCDREKKSNPTWCLHVDCKCLSCRQGICVGRLSVPISHDGIDNTHRVCLEHGDRDDGVLDLHVNWGDLWQFVSFINAVARDEGRVPFAIDNKRYADVKSTNVQRLSVAIALWREALDAHRGQNVDAWFWDNIDRVNAVIEQHTT